MWVVVEEAREAEGAGGVRRWPACDGLWVLWCVGAEVAA